MSDTKNNKPRIKGVDDAGIRLAPPPAPNSGYHVMPTVMQEFVIEPHLVTEERSQESDSVRAQSTANDFQPKKEDANKKWKRGKRAKNMTAGIIAFLASVAVLLPYILSAVNAEAKLPFVLVADRFNVVGHFIDAFKRTAELGWKGETIGKIWLGMIPDIVITIGILSVLINMIKSVFAIFGAIKPIKYVRGAIVNLICVLAIFVTALVGANGIGIAKIDFMQDFIHGYQTSYLFTMLVFGAGYVLLCGICAIVNREKYGYLK